MAQTYNKMKIDIKEPVTDIITAKLNDSNSRFLDVYLYDGGVPIDLTGHEVRIYMLKADGTEIFNNGTITEAASGRCQFELTDQALGAYGKLLCEISIWYDNVQILTSQTFDIHVVKNLRTAGSIESSNEYGALVVLYQNLYESIDLMTTMVEQFGEPGEVADATSIATFWQMLEYLYGVNEAALKNASVSEVLERIGLNTDGEGSGTLFGAINPLAGLINDIGNTVIERLKQYIPSDTIKKTLTGTVKSTNTANNWWYHLVSVCDAFVPEKDGVIKLKITANFNTACQQEMIIYAVQGESQSFETAGTVLKSWTTSSIVVTSYINDTSKKASFGSSSAQTTGTFSEYLYVGVKKGLPVSFIGYCKQYANSSTSTTYNVNVTIDVLYDEE